MRLVNISYQTGRLCSSGENWYVMKIKIGETFRLRYSENFKGDPRPDVAENLFLEFLKTIPDEKVFVGEETEGDLQERLEKVAVIHNYRVGKMDSEIPTN